MPYPPAVPPATRTNPTISADNHPSDHNALSAALTEIINHTAAAEASLTTHPTVVANFGSGLIHTAKPGLSPISLPSAGTWFVSFIVDVQPAGTGWGYCDGYISTGASDLPIGNPLLYSRVFDWVARFSLTGLTVVSAGPGDIWLRGQTFQSGVQYNSGTISAWRLHGVL